MEYTSYVVRRRAKFDGLTGPVNLPYGTALDCREGLICHKGKPVCYAASQNAHDYLSQNDDGRGLERGRLVCRIVERLRRRDKEHQARWDRLWGDPLARSYRRREHGGHWLWSHAFFNAPVDDLRHIAALTGVLGREGG